MSVATQQAVVGPTVTGADIEHAIISTLQAWLPAYICEIERQHGETPGSTPTPRGWAITGRDLQKLTSDQLPCVVLQAGGITNAPRREGGTGVYSAVWGVDLAVVFAAAWGRSSRERAQWYARALQLTVEQRPMSVALTDQDVAPLLVDWRGELYDEIDFADTRSYSAAVCALNVECREVCWATGGPPPPAEPPSDPTVPFAPWTEITSVDIDVENNPPD